MARLEFLQGCPERPLYEAVIMKPKLQWKHWRVVDARNMGLLLKHSARIECTHTKREIALELPCFRL